MKPSARVGLLGLVLVAMPATVPAQATFHGNVARTGVFDGAGPVTAPRPKWLFKAAGPIVTTPAVVEEVVYLTSLSGHLYALDRQTGAERWNFKSRMPIASSPTVADGVVYFVSSAGSLAAIDAANGQPHWVYAVEHERRFEARNLHGYAPATQTIPDAWDMFVSSPAVADGTVFFGSGDGNVYAVDANTGVLQWKFAAGDVVHASPAVARGVVYVGSYDGKFYALDATTGQQKWAFQGGLDPAIHNQQGFQASAAVVDGVVYVGSRDAHVYALDAATGRKKWDYPTSKSWVNATPAVRDGLVYAATSDSSRFFALDARTGRLRFNFDAKSYVFSSPALAGKLAYFGSHNGRVYAVDAANGQLTWEFQTEASRRNEDGLLQLDGRLDRDSFKPVFGDFQDMYVDFARFVSIGAIFGSPTVDRGVLYVGSTDGNLYALE
ncbi:MAG TPA: PQQ-binding-like beta-propeller repeat protein [Steroidobacteraceae bacterium]|nr:PQQ-binding-like beta-propeller repeat protein [Steroidobacteraceae bacterium]